MRQRRLVRLATILSALLATLLLTQILVAGEESPPASRTLHPGDNLIGWVGFATTPQALFDQIPNAELIYTWDADDARYRFSTPGFSATLSAIEPGMGLIVRIAGEQPVEWHQPTVADGEWVALKPGPNLVAWTGPSGTPIDLAVRSIGASFTQALYSTPDSGELALYQAGSRPAPGPQHQLRRGDGLWVFNTTEASWLQPSGDRALYPLGPPPDHLRWYATFDKYLDADGLAIMATENVADEALFRAAAIVDELLVNRPDVRETLIRRREHIVVVGESEQTFDLAPYRQYRDRIELEGHGPGGPRGLGPNGYTPTLVPEENLLCYEGDRYNGYDVAVHEFAHAIDFAISRGSSSGSFRSALVQSYRQAREAGWLEGTYAMTNSAEYWAEGVLYWFGLRGQSYSGISNRIELSQFVPSLAHLVAETLGVADLSATCHRAEARSQGATRKSLVSMTMLGSDGESLADVRLTLNPRSSEQTAIRTRTWQDGTVSAFVEPGGYLLLVTVEGCNVYYAQSGLMLKQRSAETIAVGNEDLSISVQLPVDLCHHRITGRVVNAQGAPVSALSVSARRDEGTTYQWTRSDGTFSLRLPEADKYRLRVRFEDCIYAFDGTGLASEVSADTLFEAQYLAGRELELRLPVGACAGQISGRVLDERGEPASESFVGIYYSWFTSNPKVQADGSFALSVDRPGEHILMVSTPFCYVYFGENGFSTDPGDAIPLKMKHQNISDLEIMIPPNVCDS